MAERLLPPARHELRDAPFRWVAAGAAWLALAVGLVIGLAWWLYPSTMTDQYVATPVPEFAQPQLQSAPRLDMSAFLAKELKALNGTYWLDREHGVVHLPVQDAMRKVAEEGIPDWPAAQPEKR